MNGRPALSDGRLRLAIPNKGRLAEPAIALLREAGYQFEADDRRLELRGWFVRLAFDHLEMVGVLTVAPVIEERGCRVDVDPRSRRRPREPAQPFHGDR